jgi:UTP:GlnB (protein PII) uridylyltransferase
MWAAVEAAAFPRFLRQPSAPDARFPRPTPAATSSLTTLLRRQLRALARDPARLADEAVLGASTRPILDAARAELVQWREGGASDRQVALVWTRLVDAAVIEAHRLARFQSAIATIVAPLTVVAIGAYGEQELLPEQGVGLLLIVPPDRREFAGRRMAHHLTESLKALGLATNHSTATPGACAAFARDNARVAVTLSTGRHLAGSNGPWAAIRAQSLG